MVQPKDRILVVLVVACSGAFSMGVLAIAAQGLSTFEMKKLSTNWAVINAVSLMFQYPIENYLPRVLNRNLTLPGLRQIVSIKATKIQIPLTLLTILVVLGFQSFQQFRVDLGAQTLIAILILSMGISITARGVNFTLGDFGLAAKIGTFQIICLVLFAGISTLTYTVSLRSIFAFVSISLVLPVLIVHRSAIFEIVNIRKVMSTSASKRIDLNDLTSISITNFIDISISTGGLVVLAFLEPLGREHLAYSSSLGLLGGLAMLINSQNFRFSRRLSQIPNLYDEASRCLIKAHLLSLGGAVVLMGGVAYLKFEEVFRLVFPRVSPLHRELVVLMWLALGIAVMSNAMKIVLVAAGFRRSLIMTWVGGLVIFALSVNIPLSAMVRVSSASLMSQGFLFTSSILILRRAHVLQRLSR